MQLAMKSPYDPVKREELVWPKNQQSIHRRDAYLAPWVQFWRQIFKVCHSLTWWTEKSLVKHKIWPTRKQSRLMPPPQKRKWEMSADGRWTLRAGHSFTWGRGREEEVAWSRYPHGRVLDRNQEGAMRGGNPLGTVGQTVCSGRHKQEQTNFSQRWEKPTGCQETRIGWWVPSTARHEAQWGEAGATVSRLCDVKGTY